MTNSNSGEQAQTSKARSWKKLVISLAAGSIFSLSIGAGFVVGTQGMKQSALQDFLGSAKAQVVHVFDRSAWEQKAIDSWPRLANYLDGQPVKAGSFASNPQSYANWIENQSSTDRTYYSVDFSKIGHQASLVSELAQVITSYQRHAVAKSQQDESETRPFSPFDPHHPEYERWLTNSLQHALEEETVAGFSVMQTQGRVHILVNTLVTSGQDATSLDEPFGVGHKGLSSITVQSQEPTRLIFRVATYSQSYVEEFSALGVKGKQTVNQIEGYLHDKAGYVTDLAEKNPLEVLLMGAPPPEYKKVVQGSNFSERTLKAMKVAQERNPLIFGDLTVTHDLLQSAVKKYADFGVMDNRSLASALKHLAVQDEYNKSASEEAVNLFVSTLDQPCPPGVGKEIANLIEQYAVKKAQECAESHDQSVPLLWQMEVSAGITVGIAKNPMVMVGFQDGIAVFLYTEADDSPGKTFNYSKTDNSQSNANKRWITDSENALVIVNPFSRYLDSFSAQDKARITEFTMHHEIFHAKSMMDKKGEPVNELDNLRSVSDETQADVYAARKMFDAGYSESEVLDIHRKMSESFNENPQLFKGAFRAEDLDRIKDGVWLGAQIDSRSTAQGLIEQGESVESLNFNFGGEKMNELMDYNNRLEFRARHEAVKLALQSTSGSFDETLTQPAAPR